MFAGLLAFIIHYRCSAWTFRRNLSISNTERLWQALSSICRSSATLSAYLSDLWVNLGAARRPSALIWSRMMKVGGDGRGWMGLGVGLGGAGAAVALDGCLQGDTVSRVSWDKQTQMDRWRLRVGSEGGRGENEGGKLTDVQTNKLEFAMAPRCSWRRRSKAHRALLLLFCCHFCGSRRQILEHFMLTGP